MSLAVPPPSAEAQLAFLAKLQRLFSEGDFTATYKFALLIALADLAVELGRPTTAPSLLCPTSRSPSASSISIGDTQCRMALDALGRSQVCLFKTSEPKLRSTAIAEFRAGTNAATVQQARVVAGYESLVSRVASTVSAQPLTYLQNFGGLTNAFLYERAGRGTITLKPGVAYCLRRFHPLVQQLSRSHWVEHIKANRRNHVILGDAGDLEDFLFSISRQSLAIIASGLRRLDGDRCFYCGQGLSLADVDHFVPFSCMRGTWSTTLFSRTQRATEARPTHWRLSRTLSVRPSLTCPLVAVPVVG